MARSAILSNGRLSVGLDEKGLVNDFYYPHVGLSNMTSARLMHHKIGISVNDQFTWLDNSDFWEIKSSLDENSMTTHVSFWSQKYNLELVFRDFVDINNDFFGRVVIINNHGPEEKNCKLFFCQVFQISDSGRADTAIYTPADHPYILSYYSNTSFITSLRTEQGNSFDQFAIGNYGIESKVGTYIDAEDGELSGNLVEHGGVDSVIRTSFEVRAKHAYHVDYWITASDESYHQSSELHRSIAADGLLHYLSATTIYWKKWLEKSSTFLAKIDTKYLPLAKKSLFTIRAHCDKYGGVIASLDSSIYNYGRDYYSYIWPRDAYYSLSPLLKLGYTDETKSFLEFIFIVISKHGYVHHKYLPNYSLGSTWHPLLQYGEREPNIQEDETAAVVLLAIDYIAATGVEDAFSKKLWDLIIVPCCDYMSLNIDKDTGLPHASYDLWEQVFQTTTYSTSIVYASLKRATELSSSFDDQQHYSQWQKAVDLIQNNFGRLFEPKKQYYVRGLMPAKRGYAQDETIDIGSLYGIAMYGPVKRNDASVQSMLQATETSLVNQSGIGGVVRYPGDLYMRNGSSVSANPWYVCTLWLGQCYYALGEVEKAYEALDWVLSRASTSGMLSEQVDPETGDMRGVAPLVWSHAEFLSLLQTLFV